MQTRLISTVAAAVIAIILGAATRSRETMLLAVPLICYIGASRIRLPSPPDLRVTRSVTPRRLTVGETVRISLEIDVSPRRRASRMLGPGEPASTPDGRRPGPDSRILSAGAHYFVFADRLPAGMGGTWQVIRGIDSSADRTTVQTQYTCRPRRGIHRLHGIHVWFSDPAGLWPEHRFVPAPARIAAFPRLRVRTGLTLRPRRTLLFGGTIPAGEGGAGLHFFDVRDYRSGDSLRHINWKASARRPRRPVINEFEPERATDIGLVVDARQATWPGGVHGERVFDAAVEAAAGLTDLLLDMGNRLGLLVYGGAIDWLPPGSGRIQRERALTRLAAATVREHLVFNDLGRLPLHLFPAGSQLVIVSSIQLEDIGQLVRLVARGYRVLVVTPVVPENKVHDQQASGLGARLLEVERVVVRRRLGQYGIAAIRWSTDEPLAACLARENQRLTRMRPGGRARV